MRLLSALVRLGGALMLRVVKAALLAAMLAGVPYGLVTQIGAPLPSAIPTARHLGHVLTGPVSDTVVLNLLALAVWVLWAAFILSLVVEVAAAIRGVPRPRLGPLAPLQTLTGWLVAAATASVLVAAPALAVTGHPGPATANSSVSAAISTDTHRPVPPAPDAAAPLRATTPTTPTTNRHAPAPGSPAPAATTTTSALMPVYQVDHGDRLGDIARRFLGDFNRYPEIRDLNPDLIPDPAGRHGPDHIEPTWRLILPADAHDRGGHRHATGRLVVSPADPGPAAGTGPDAGTPDPATPAPSPRMPAPATPSASAPTVGSPAVAAPVPGGAANAPPTTSPTEPPSPTTTLSPPAAPGTDPPAQAHDHRGAGVALPGGWVGVPLAGALVAAAAMVWLRRRHRYVPPPPGPAPLDDPDLQPLPPVLTTLRRAVREHAPDLLHPTRPAQPTVTEYTGGDAETRPDLPPVGPGGTDLAGAGGRVGVGGLGLLGAGAGAAARALLVATLSSGTPADPDARGRIVIPADTLSDLLGAHAAQVGPLPRLTVTADLSEALTHVEELLIERRRVLQEHETTDVAGIRAADPFHPPMPPVLLLSQTPPPHLRARLTTTLHLGAPLQISAVLLGQWPRGDTLSVGPHGHTTGGDPTRLAVLDVPSTRQLLAVLQEAHTGQPTTTHVVTPAGPDPAAPAPRAATGPSTVEDAPPPDPTTAVAPAPTPPTTPEDHTGAATGAAQTNPAPQTRAHPPHPVRIRLLGETTILDRDNNPVPGLRHHARELLVYLAVHRSGADLSQIMEAFWPTATVRRASERLSTEAGDLRRRIRQAAADNNIQPLVNTGGHYHLHPDLLDIDVWRLIDALHQATASTEPATRIAALRQAVHTHTGGLAEGHHYDWIDQPREQLRRHGIRARLQLAQLLGGTEPAAAADLTRSAADLDPLNEDAARQSMRALAVIGDTAGIRTRLQQLRDALDDIDEEPAGETIALAAQLQRTISTAGRPGPPPAGREPGTGNRTTAPATAPPPAAHSRDRACP